MTFDGSPLDIGIFLFAVVVAGIRAFIAYRLHGSCGVSTKSSTNDLLNALSLVPFAFMIGSIFSSQILKLALETQRIYMAVGGAIGAMAVASALLKKPKAQPVQDD